ncbi:monovalent cation/H+ antiporter subunit D [Staphylococcus gallinarum]|uniref:Monovalent cation/H+ antiporter subunit D n=1 Tax=Staphylococcus gallinarum TaxID=1293 RepID=A0A380FEB3_STAGA|nr:monovalent cation/H+ antiporter subunit D [Staphylococcus gallinarum]
MTTMSNLLIFPLLLPAVCALLLVFIRTQSRLSRIFSIGTMALTTIISLMLLISVMVHGPIKLDFGGWQAPFWYSICWRFIKLINGYCFELCCNAYYGLWIW